VAFMSRIISRREEFSALAEAEMAFSAGLLHDIGKLVIISEMPAEHQAIQILLKGNAELAVSHAEDQVLGFSHADIGGILATKWNLPESLCEAIGNHHQPEAVASQKQTAIIHLSNYLGHCIEYLENKPPNLSPHYGDSWSIIGISRSQEGSLLDLLRNEYAKAETFVNIMKGPL
jgi:HD-like signal output (HDOD) protein